MTNLDSILKSRGITLLTKVSLVKAMVFPLCESCTTKKAEHWRIDAFELWCWRRLLRVPWTARSFSRSILKEISPRISLEEMMLKLRLQYFGHLMRRVDSLEKTLMLGGIVHPKGNQFWIFIGRTHAEVETPILWLPDEKNWLIGKDPDAVKDWRQQEKGTTEDEMVGWHHPHNGHVFK